MDRLTTLRRRDEELREILDRLGEETEPGALCWVGKTTHIAAYPTTARAYYAVQPCDAAGPETEGTTGTCNCGNVPALAMNVGNSVPPEGTYLIVTRVGNRNCFRYG